MFVAPRLFFVFCFYMFIDKYICLLTSIFGDSANSNQSPQATTTQFASIWIAAMPLGVLQ